MVCLSLSRGMYCIEMCFVKCILDPKNLNRYNPVTTGFLLRVKLRRMKIVDARALDARKTPL